MEKLKTKPLARHNNFSLTKKETSMNGKKDSNISSNLKSNLNSNNPEDLIKDLMVKEKILSQNDSRPNKTFNVDFLSRNSTNLVSGPETERKKLVRDIQSNDNYQESFLKTKYSCELMKNCNKNTDENMNSLYPNNRSDIFYLKDIIFKNQNDVKEKRNIAYQGLKDPIKKRETLPKIRNQRKYSTNTAKVATQENKIIKEKVFTQNMENYYTKLNNLKSQSINEIKPEQKSQEVTTNDKKTPNFRISVMFGKDQTRELFVKEELSIFKNLHGTGDRLSPEKSNLSNFINLSKRKTPSIKNYEITFKKKDKFENNSMNRMKTSHNRNIFDPSNYKSEFYTVYQEENKMKYTNLNKKKIHLIAGIKKSTFNEKRTDNRVHEISQQQTIENKFNLTSFTNFKKIEDYKVNVEEIPNEAVFEHENLKKVKIINDFLSKQDKEKFRSEKTDYRKIYVILDGTIIINTNRIPGKFIDIIKTRIYKGKEFKKKRSEYLYNFVCEINKEFNPIKRIRNIFLMNGTPVFDIIDIPENDRFVFVSHLASFRSIILSNSNNTKLLDLPIELNKTADFKNSNFMKNNKIVFRKKKKFQTNQKLSRMLHFNIISKKEYFEKYEKNYKDNTFVEENISVDDWQYKSDNELTKIPVGRKLHEEFQTPNEMLVYFTEIWADNKQKHLRSLLRCDNEGNIIKSSIKENKSIENLVDNYNQERDKRFNNYLNVKKEKKNQSNTMKKTNDLMKTFIQNLGIIKENKEDFYDDDMMNDYQQKQFEKNKKHMILNKQKVTNLYFQIEKRVNKLFPDLISMNIPKLLATYPTLTRKELFELFVQYKSLLKICIALNKSMKILKKGVDFRTFHQGVSQMSTESEELAKKIFTTINETKNNYLSWEEFLKGMITIKSESISDKIDMFFKIIDTDGNGLLSYDEVLDLSLMSLKRNIKGEDKASLDIINELAKYFADLIFKLVDIDKDDEIPLPKIKEKIIEGGEEAAYLEMFCCADNFKGNNKITFN